MSTDEKWKAARDAAQRIVELADDAWFRAPEDRDELINRVCTELDRIAKALGIKAGVQVIDRDDRPAAVDFAIPAEVADTFSFVGARVERVVRRDLTVIDELGVASVTDEVATLFVMLHRPTFIQLVRESPHGDIRTHDVRRGNLDVIPANTLLQLRMTSPY